MKTLSLITGLGAALALGLTGVAQAEESAARRPPPVEEQLERYAGTELEDDVQCRQISRTGTRIRWTVCLTSHEWEQIREESREALARLTGNGIGTGA